MGWEELARDKNIVLCSSNTKESAKRVDEESWSDGGGRLGKVEKITFLF